VHPVPPPSSSPLCALGVQIIQKEQRQAQIAEKARAKAAEEAEARETEMRALRASAEEARVGGGCRPGGSTTPPPPLPNCQPINAVDCLNSCTIVRDAVRSCPLLCVCSVLACAVQAEREAAAREAERKRKNLQKQLEDNDAVLRRKAQQAKAEAEEDKAMMDAVRGIGAHHVCPSLL
jgi:hypothetical protein